MIAWPHPKDEAIKELGEAISAPHYIMMHGDRFEPGKFYCNFDYSLEKRRVERILPATTAVVLERTRRITTD